MGTILQLLAVFLDCCIAGLILYVLWIAVSAAFQQLYIRMRCKYRGFKEKPGRACVICDYQRKCGRAWKSKEYERYFFCRITHPDQAQKLFEEIREEEARYARSKWKLK